MGRFFRSSIFFGAVAGPLVVVAQPLFGIYPPQAYGVCTVCHIGDLLTWTAAQGGIEMKVGGGTLPLLTTVGIVVGAFVAAIFNREFRLMSVSALLPMFPLGVLVGLSAMILLSCPTRLILRMSYGDPYAILGLIGLVAGVYLGVVVFRVRSRV